MKPWIAGLILWLLVGGLAAAVLGWQWAHPPQLPAVTQPGGIPELPPAPVATPFKLPPPEHYRNIVAHPVFIAARLPEPPPPEDGPPEKPPTALEPAPVLLGVMIMPQLTLALLRPEQPGAKAVRIKIGEMVGEWRLEAVFPNRVVLSKGQTQQEVALVKPAPRPAKRTVMKPLAPARPPDGSQPPGAPPANAPPNPP